MLAGTGRPVDGPSLMNLAMELRKCCNHPFLLKGVERQEEARLTGQTERERLVGACVQAPVPRQIASQIVPGKQ